MDFFLLLWTLISYGILAALTILFIISVILYMVTKPYPVVERLKEEISYYDHDAKCKQNFPNIEEIPTINLSVIVPAYNEEERLPPMLDEAIDFLEARLKAHPKYTYEIIVVSDGSRDGTTNVTESYTRKYGSNKVRCLKLIKNRGKGGAVRLGVQSCRGAVILFADADGASKFEDLTKLEEALKVIMKCDYITDPSNVKNSVAIAIGSRAHLEQESLATRSIFRNILMYGFHFLVWLFAVKDIKDTQCGFKLFTRQAAYMCFESLHVNRWAFDVELLYIAQRLNIPIVEIPIRWTEIDGSKITPVLSWLQMGCDLGLIWLKYAIGAWKIKSQKAE